MKRVITFGTFDVFHLGHLNILERAKSYGDQLIVGVSTDKLTYEKKQRYPIYNEEARCRIVSALKDVDKVFHEEALELKPDYIRQYKADVLVMGDDWKGKFDGLSMLCEIVYLARTPSISTTAVIEIIKSR